ncbi:polymer-forming cytoskeletal protein [Mucilaginibacter sp.]|uniref:bactofilin family protein n=1 Tax=Mucilaginibacter sp. TaxID=1882438 RepID=UPI0026101862|nr:polymer-forming cytoskeletal protein [Mucilaginibacter sp.]MDB4927485.1 polymer-forming cytoskeletal protein [Mucilaginibacter sp.]
MLSIFKKETPQVTESISNIKELISEGNDYFSEELIILDEKLTGNLFCAEKVSIEPRGVLTGNITSKLCVVNGTVNGDITSLDLLDIKATAVVRGNIQSATVHIEPGAVINGYITIGEDIDALTEQWNKTKFSTDDYLANKLAGELAELNKENKATNIVVKQEVKPEPVAAIVTEEKHIEVIIDKADTPPEPVAVKEQEPAPAIAEASLKKENNSNNTQRWW